MYFYENKLIGIDGATNYMLFVYSAICFYDL